jgi:integrase
MAAPVGEEQQVAIFRQRDVQNPGRQRRAVDRGDARTWNRHRSAVRSFTAWAAGPGRGWVTADLAALVERRPETRDKTRAIARHEVEELLDRRGVPLREKTLWRLLYESAARADSVLAIDIEDLVLPAKRARVTAKGGVVRWVQWQTGTARLLPRLIADRTSGPLFLAHRRPAPARIPADGDICRTPDAPGCPTSAPSTCSSRPPAARPSTSCATRG